MKKDLPIFDIVLNDENQGVGMISLVDDPAIKVNWIKLAKQNPMLFKADKDKQMLYGPFLIPNMLIYRYDEFNGEYYVRFSSKEIEKIATKFNEDLNNKNINFMHTDQKVDAFVATNWLIEGEQDKSRNLNFDLPEGTWFGGVKIKDESFWKDKVKNEEVKGFSVEILADLELSLKNKEEQMKKLNLAQATLKDGVVVWYDGDLAVGTAIFIDEEMTQAAPDAEHELEDGTIVVTVDGVVTEIREVEAEVEAVEDVPAEGSAPLTAEEVSAMIDSRFGELMDEINALKSSLDVSQEELSKYKKQVEEKFSLTPATQTIENKKSPTNAQFEFMEARIKEFARTK
jgi:hypothetical protein